MPEHDGAEAPTIDLDGAFFQDPFAAYRRLRRYGDVHRITTGPDTGLWLVTGYDTAVAALRNPRLSKDPDEIANALRTSAGSDMAALSRVGTYGDLMRSFSHHVRAVVREQLRPALVDRVAASLPSMAEAVLDRIADPGAPADLVADFTIPFAAESACALIGIPGELRDEVTSLLTETILSPDRGRERAASQRLARLLAGLLTERTVEPRADLLTAISTKVTSNTAASETEMVRGALLLLIISVETTFAFLGNAIYALLTHPDQLAPLRADPVVGDAAIEELLRFDGAHNISSLRCAVADLTLGGTAVAAGELVAVALASANHDEARFDGAEELDLARAVNGHLAFGHGMHRCLGARYARLQGRAALETLLRRYPDLRLAVAPAQVPRMSSAFLRSIGELPVVLAPADVS